jgi:hypothetical protein
MLNDESHIAKKKRRETITYWVAIIGLIAAIFGVYQTQVNSNKDEDRYQEKKTEEQTKLALDSSNLIIKKRTTFSKLDKYRKLIHEKRDDEFETLYEELKKLISDSSIFIDNDFKAIVSNHTTLLQMWMDRVHNENLKTDEKTLESENYSLKIQNESLYHSICSKYKNEIDVAFFQGIYFY